MSFIFEAQKNSNIFDYVKCRVQNNNLDYLLENGVASLLSQFTIELDIDSLVFWQDGTLEISVYSSFYINNDPSVFKDSLSKRDDIKGFNRESNFYIDNRQIFIELEHCIKDLTKPMLKSKGKDFFGYSKDGKSNLKKLYFFEDRAFVKLVDKNLIPEKNIEFLSLMKKSEFYFLYEEVAL